VSCSIHERSCDRERTVTLNQQRNRKKDGKTLTTAKELGAALVAATLRGGGAANSDGVRAGLRRKGSEVGLEGNADVVGIARVAASVGDAGAAAVNSHGAGLQGSHSHIADVGDGAGVASLAAG